MDIKKAFTYCLLIFLAASIVVLMVKSLRSSPQSAGVEPAIQNGVIVYYFHGNTRCPTCCSIESQTQDTVRANFASQLSGKEMSLQMINYEQPAAKQLVDKFEIQMPVVVLARLKNGEIQDWKRLDEVWGLVDDKAGFTNLVQGEINRILTSENKPSPVSTQQESPKPVTPGPNSDSAADKERAEIPLP